MASAATRLAALETSITEVKPPMADGAFKQYTIRGRTVRRSDFARLYTALRKEERTLQSLVDRGSMMRVAKFSNAR